MKIFVIGAGQVGSTIVEALHDEHELTVVDVDPTRLTALSNRYDVMVIEGNGAVKSVLEVGGISSADLVIACTSVDEPNIIAAMLARKLAPGARTIVRTSNVEYLELWRERQLDVFADGQVQIVEFDVVGGASDDVVGKQLREAKIPENSKVAAIIRTG